MATRNDVAAVQHGSAGEHGDRIARSQAERPYAARRATAMPSTWGPRTSEVARIGKPYALRELRGYLDAVAVTVPSPTLLELAAQVDAELPLRDAAPAETQRPPCTGCGRCTPRRRATAVRPPPKRGPAA